MKVTFIETCSKIFQLGQKL